MHFRIVALCSVAVAACRLQQPPTPTAVSDSTSVARAVSLAAVPRFDAATPVTLRVDASRVGGSFAASFEREMAPAVNFAKSRGGAAATEVVVLVESLEIGNDSAVAVVSESGPGSATRLRMLLLPRSEGGWRVVAQQVLAHADSGALPPRTRPDTARRTTTRAQRRRGS